MFNDDVLAKCPQCGSAETALTQDATTCGTCGYSESFALGDEAREGMQKDVENALRMAKARDVLQRWDFAG